MNAEICMPGMRLTLDTEKKFEIGTFISLVDGKFVRVETEEEAVGVVTATDETGRTSQIFIYPSPIPDRSSQDRWSFCPHCGEELNDR